MHKHSSLGCQASASTANNLQGYKVICTGLLVTLLHQKAADCLLPVSINKADCQNEVSLQTSSRDEHLFIIFDLLIIWKAVIPGLTFWYIIFFSDRSVSLFSLCLLLTSLPVSFNFFYVRKNKHECCCLPKYF